MECMGRTVVDFYVCLVVSVEAGEWHLEKKEVARSQSLNLGREAILNLRETCGFPVLLWALKGVKLRYCPWWVCFLFVCFFWPITHSVLKIHTWPAAAWISPLGITKALFLVPLPPLPPVYQILTDPSLSFLISLGPHQPHCTALLSSFVPVHPHPLLFPGPDCRALSQTLERHLLHPIKYTHPLRRGNISRNLNVRVFPEQDFASRGTKIWPGVLKFHSQMKTVVEILILLKKNFYFIV